MKSEAHQILLGSSECPPPPSIFTLPAFSISPAHFLSFCSVLLTPSSLHCGHVAQDTKAGTWLQAHCWQGLPASATCTYSQKTDGETQLNPAGSTMLSRTSPKSISPLEFSSKTLLCIIQMYYLCFACYATHQTNLCIYCLYIRGCDFTAETTEQRPWRALPFLTWCFLFSSPQ